MAYRPMLDIEDRDESNAVQRAWDEADEQALNRDPDGQEVDRAAFRAGWLAGRDWARSQAPRCAHGHANCCGHHDQEDMPIHGRPA